MKFRELPREVLGRLLERKKIGPGTNYQADSEVPQEFLTALNIATPQQEAQTFREDRAKELTGHQEGGLFRYEMKANKGDQEEVSSFTRRKPLSQQDKDFLKNTMGKYLGTEDVDFKFTVKDDPQKEFAYVMENGLIDLPKGTSYQEALDIFGYNPSQFRAIAMGEEPSMIGQVSDMMSAAGRNVAASARALGEGEYDPRERGRLTSDMNTPWYNPAKIAADAARSPTAPLAILTGAAVPTAPSVMTNVMREAALGAAEGAIETGLSKQRGLSDPSLKDLALNVGLGGAIGGAVPATIQGGKALKDTYKAYKMGKEGPSLKDRFLQYREDMANIPGNIGGDPNQAAARKLLAGGKGAPYKAGARKRFSELLGLDPDEMYPGLGIEFRGNQNAVDLRTLATKSPELHKRWMGTYQKLLEGIDKWTNYSKAPDLTNAATVMEDAAARAKNNMFEDASVTYNSIINDPQKGLALDAEFTPEVVQSLEKQLGGLRAKYEQKLSRVAQRDPDTGAVMLGEDGLPMMKANVDLAPVQARELDGALKAIDGLQKVLADRELAAPGTTNQFVKELNLARANLQENVKAIPTLERTKVKEDVTSDLRDLLRDSLMDGVERVDKTLHEDLVYSNQKISDYNKALGVLSRDLGKDAKSGEAISKAILGNDKKMDALGELLVENGELEAFETLRDAWFKHKVMKEAASTGEVKSAIAKPLGDSEAFIRKWYPDAPYKEIEDYAQGLLAIGDPQLIGLSSTMREGAKDVLLPTTGNQAMRMMSQAFTGSADAADLSKATDIIADMKAANTADFGARQYEAKGRLGQLMTNVGMGGPVRAGADVSENEQAQPETKRNLWEALSR